ncbi:MAG: C_GCAxxG_C_C family protein [Spirochaetota bacterium]|nr:MAG: C_GCAxxG_C_C family protein [Spirochaetota bacterium]
MNNEITAVSSFNSGFNCAQAVLAAFCERYGLDKSEAVKVACGFGGGMGRMANVCGAVSGAFMVLGLRYCSSGDDLKSSKEETYSKVREFTDRFKVLHGSIICKEILGCDISSENGMRKAKEEGLFESKCSELVRDSAKILKKMI